MTKNPTRRSWKRCWKAHKTGTATRTSRYSAVQCFVCFFPFILHVKFVGCTGRGHTGFLIHFPSAVHAFIFLARRIQPFLSLVDREVEFCVLTILIVLHPLGIFIILIFE